MNIRKHIVIVGIATVALVTIPSTHAQYSANFQTNIISGVSSNWSGSYTFGHIADVLLIEGSGILVDNAVDLGGGSNNFALVTDNGSVWSNDFLSIGSNNGGHNSLVVSNGGQVINRAICTVGLGVLPTIGSNSILVTGTGSVLSNGGDLTIGYYFAANRVVVGNGGQLINSNATFGAGTSASSNNTVVVKGSGSTWNNRGGMFFDGVGSSLVISNGGQVVDTYGYLGDTSSSSNTGALVTSGSVWSNQLNLYAGYLGSRNTLVISRGGLVNNVNGYVGYASSSNSIVVTDFGSVWSNANDLYVGKGGSSNSLVIVGSGQVINRDAYIGFDANSSNNSVSVITKTTWQTRMLHVGEHGSGSLFMTLSGKTEASNLVIGVDSATCDSLVELDSSGQLFVTNATHDAVLEVRHGQLIFNSGTLQADILVMTNSCASLVHTGGKLTVGSVILDPNEFRITSVTPQGNDVRVTWLMGPGQTNALQVSAGDGSGGYNANSFSDVLVVTNNTTAGTATNYLDVGGATNKPARYYRARLVP